MGDGRLGQTAAMRRLLLLSALVACTPTGEDPADPWADGCDADEAELRTIDVGEVSLNVACRGSGPTLVLLHGFPEFWFGWDRVMDELAGDYRLIVPDQRGYNLSDKPVGVEDYEYQHMVADIAGLIDAVGGPVTLVGHDWGGGVAWPAAMELTERVERLVIMNAPHLNVFGELLANDPAQQEGFSYLGFFVTEGSEDSMMANDFGILTTTMGDALSADELVLYKEAWGQPRAVESGLNWYRANFEDGLPAVDVELVVDQPTLVMWGMDDDALLPANMTNLGPYVSDLTMEEIPGAGHFVEHDAPARIAELIRGFVP